MAQITLNSTGVASNGSLVLQSNGTTAAVTVDTAQKVGIGTSSPQEKLQLEGSGSQYMRVKTTTTNADIYFGITSSSVGYVGTGGSDPLSFFTANTERARIDSSGNLGIGTTSPTTRLHVNSASAAIATVQSTLAAGNTNVETRYISTNRSWGVGQNIIQTSSIFEIADVTASATRLAIDSSGNVLVGVTSANANGGVLQLKSGITFPATQVSATDANTLDDYEEGTWTPAQGAGLTVVGAYSSSGQYTKIGRSVTVFGLIAGATSVACTNNGQLCTGLPFTPNTEFQGALINAARSFSNNVGALGSGAVQNSTALGATASAAFTITYFV